jgi:DNA-binding transcriptional ArsR family regulator
MEQLTNPPFHQPRTSATPVLGPRARRASDISKTWQVDTGRRVLILLAAYADAGEISPSVRELTSRLKLTIEQLDIELRKLAAGGLIWVEWHADPQDNRNRYRLLFAGDVPTPGDEARKLAAWQAERERRRRRVKGNRVIA